MERQKDREGHEEAERQRSTWSGRKTEKDMERQKDREGNGEAETQRRIGSGRKR